MENVDISNVAAVHWAVYENNIEGLKLLLDVPTIDVNIADDNGRTGLINAVLYPWSCRSVFDLLLNTPNIDVNLKDNNGETGLILAVHGYKHSAWMVDLLLNTPNIDVNLKDNQGKCALHWAVEYKHRKNCECCPVSQLIVR